MNRYTVRVYYHDPRIGRWYLLRTTATVERALHQCENSKKPGDQWAILLSGDHPVDPNGNPGEFASADIGRFAPIQHRGIWISTRARSELDAYYARKGNRHISVRLTPDEQAFLAAYGSGSFSEGLRRLIADKQHENTGDSSLSDLI